MNCLARKFRTRDSRTLRATILATVFVICLASYLFYGTLTAGCLVASTCLGYLLTSFFCFQPEGLKWRIGLENMAVRTFPSYLKPTEIARETAVASVKCHKEAQKIIKLIMRDFVASWYDRLSADRAFPEDVERVLEHIALEVNLRMQTVDLDKVVSELVAIVIPYLEVLNEVGVNRDGGGEFSTRHERCVRLFENNPSVTHKALRTPDAESRHYRHLVDVAIQCCLPGEYRACGVATMFIREVLFHKVLRSLVDLLCDPDFLMAAIPLVLDKASPERVLADLEAMAEENRELDTPVDPGSVPLLPPPLRPSPVRRSRGIGRSASAKVLPRGGSLDTRLNEGGDRLFRDHKGEHDLRGREGRRGSTGKRIMDQVPLASGGKEEGPVAEEDQEEYEPEEFDEGIDLAPIYMTDNITCRDKDEVYIGYIFRFPRELLTASIQKDLNLLDSETDCEGLKRYSDFVKLRSHLNKSPLVSYVKGIDFPDKHSISSILSKLPFKDLDPNILERKKGLERYLQPWNQFKSVYSSLADYLDTAASVATSAAQHPPSHTLQSPICEQGSLHTNPLRGGRGPGDTRLRPATSWDEEEFSEVDNPSAQISPVGSVGSGCPLSTLQGAELWDLPPDHTPSHSSPCNEDGEKGLTSGIRGAEVTSLPRVPEVASVEAESARSGVLAFLPTHCSWGQRPLTHARIKQLTEDFETRMPFSNGLLALATEAARLECPETCAVGEAPQVGVLSVVGGVMDRFLWKMLHSVVYCEDTWARALYSLRNKLWPRGVFLHEDRPQLSEEQKKEQVDMAVKSLEKFLPDALPYIVGPEAYDGALRHCLECLQNKRINKSVGVVCLCCGCAW
eukprot:Em0005g1615a